MVQEMNRTEITAHAIKGIRRRIWGSRMADYIRLLREHDWEFQHSDDFRVYNRGKAERAELELRARDLDPDFRLWNLYATKDNKR